MLCFYCATAIQQKMPITGYTDKIFTETSFNNWQKALEKFRKHEQSIFHRNALGMVEKNTKDVGEMLSTMHAVKKAENRKVLLTILSSIRFLARQGLRLRGNYIISDSCSGEVQSNLMQLLQLRKNDVPLLDSWLHKSQDRFTSPDTK